VSVGFTSRSRPVCRRRIASRLGRSNGVDLPETSSCCYYLFVTVVLELILRTASLNYGARMNISMQDLNPIHQTGPSSTQKAPDHARCYRPVLVRQHRNFRAVPAIRPGEG
jgi:hypothetical protein